MDNPMPAVGAGPIISKRAQRECQEALQQLSLLADPHAAIHSVRKHIRKLRSLLALVRNPAFDLQDLDATLRRLGVSLSDARDAHVVVEAAQRLQQLHPAPGWAAVIDVLSARRARILEQLLRRDPGLQRRAMTLRRVARQLQDQPWHALRRRDVRAGLERTRRRVRKAATRATHGGTHDVEGVHRWRRRARRLRMQLELLKDMKLRPGRSREGPEHGKAARSLHQLSDRLGDMQDLRLLRNLVRAMPACSGKAVVLQLIDAARHPLPVDADAGTGA